MCLQIWIQATFHDQRIIIFSGNKYKSKKPQNNNLMRFFFQIYNVHKIMFHIYIYGNFDMLACHLNYHIIFFKWSRAHFWLCTNQIRLHNICHIFLNINVYKESTSSNPKDGWLKTVSSTVCPIFSRVPRILTTFPSVFVVILLFHAGWSRIIFTSKTNIKC